MARKIDHEERKNRIVSESLRLFGQLGYDAVHDTVHEMARDEARHGKAFAGLLKRYFG